jgi:hypothetical protein
MGSEHVKSVNYGSFRPHKMCDGDIAVVSQFENRTTLEPRCNRAIVATCPKGSQGRKSPADVIGNAVRVMRIVLAKSWKPLFIRGKNRAHKGGLMGGPKRPRSSGKKRRAEIASKAANAQWKKRS